MTRGETTDDGAQRTAKEAWGLEQGEESGFRNGQGIENRWVIGDQG